MAGERAAEVIQAGMVVGLGTGSTAYYAIKKLGKFVRAGLKIKAVASSLASEALAREEGIDVVDFSEISVIDVTIDGADEVDLYNNLIKGGGGALLREKILAANSHQFIVVVDTSKLVTTLGQFPLPIEIAPFAHTMTIKVLEEQGCKVKLRDHEGKVFISDNGNYIADCFFERITDVMELNDKLLHLPGVVETGLFPNEMVSYILVGEADGTVTHLNGSVFLKP